MRPSLIPHEPAALRALDPALTAIAKAQLALMNAYAEAARLARQHECPILGAELEDAFDRVSSEQGGTNGALSCVKQRLRTRAAQEAAAR